VTEPQTVIVYRNRVEQTTDEFFYAHPEYVLGFLGVAIVVVWVFWLGSTFQFHRRWRRR
jgi:hypothetical protein